MSAIEKQLGNANQPLYLVARDQLITSLAKGVYPPGSALPAEKTLATLYGISVGTLRKAVDELVNEGLLLRQQGRGTFVASHDRERLLYFFFHIVRIGGHKDSYPVVTLNKFSRGRADAKSARLLQIEVADPVIKIRNVQRLQNQPLIVDDITLSQKNFANMTEQTVSRRAGTMYQLYQEEFGLTVADTEERLRAVSAPANIAGLLSVNAGTPLLLTERLAVGYEREPIELRVSHVDTRTHEYFNDRG
jgi:GntR family transcriptional regulator